MKSTKTFNNISDKLKAEIPTLKPGQVVTFQMLNGIPNPEPDEKERSRNPILYGKSQVQTNFRIYDPYVKDGAGNEVGGYVDVGCVDIWGANGVPDKFRLLVPGMGEYSQFQGKFSLHAGNIRDEELYEILWLSNEREGNPHRDKSVAPLFKIVDVKADSRNTTNKVSQLRKALEISEKLDAKKARAIMASLNQPYYADDEVVKAKVQELARDKYEDFLKTYEDKNTDTKGLLRDALNAGVLKHEVSTGIVRLGSTEITTIKVGNQDALVGELTKFVNSAANGKDVFANIEKQLEKKEKKAASA